MATTSESAAARDQGREAAEVRRLVHDLNNVLVAVVGFADIVAADARDGRVEPRDAEQALAASRRAIELVQQIGALLDGRPRPDAG
jgi:hypothetical protein